MAMGIVHKDDFEKEMQRLGIVVNEKEIEQYETELKEIERGRGDKKETPESIREFIAAEAICGADINTLRDEMGISKSSISAYKNGATSTATYHKPDESLAKANMEVRDKITGKAQAKLINALDAIDIIGEKLKPREAADIAMKMSSVVKNLQPDASNMFVNQNKVVIFKPRMREEDDYEVLQVME
jgi:hypothetical protein